MHGFRRFILLHNKNTEPSPEEYEIHMNKDHVIYGLIVKMATLKRWNCSLKPMTCVAIRVCYSNYK